MDSSYSFTDNLRYEYTHAVLLLNPSLAAVSTATKRDDTRYVFTIGLHKTAEHVHSSFKDYWLQSSDNDSDSSGQQFRSSHKKVWELCDFLPGDNPNLPLRPVNQFVTVTNKNGGGGVTIRANTRFRILTRGKTPKAIEFHILRLAVIGGAKKKVRAAFCRSATVRRTPKQTWVWETPRWVAAGHIRPHACTDLDANELALAQQVDISDAATAPHHVRRGVNIVMKNCDACPLDYVVPLRDADVDLTKD